MKFSKGFFDQPIKTTGVVNPVRRFLDAEERKQRPRGELAPLDLTDDGRHQVDIEAQHVVEVFDKRHTETFSIRIPVDGDAEKFALPEGEHRFEGLEVEVWNAKGKRDVGSRWSAKGIVAQPVTKVKES